MHCWYVDTVPPRRMFLTHSTLRRVPLVAFYHGVGAESGRLAGGRRGAGSQEVTRSLAVAWSWNMGLDMELDMELDMGAAPTLPLSRISRRPVEARCLYSGPEYMYTLMRARHRTCDKVLCRMYSSTKPCVLKPRAWPATYRLEPRLRLRSSNRPTRGKRSAGTAKLHVVVPLSKCVHCMEHLAS